MSSDLPPNLAALAKVQPGGFLTTDGGNAEQFAADHGSLVRYCHPWAKWLAWDGRRWELDARGRLMQQSKATTRAMLREAAGEADDDRRKARVRWAMASDSRPRREAMLALAQSEPGIPVLPDELDRDPWRLCVQNGTVDLHTGELRRHDPRDLITKIAPVAFDPSADAPRWRRFLEEVLPDADVRSYVQRAAGYSLSGDVSEQCLFFAYGVGANGKSTFLATLRDLLGDYAIQARPDLLMSHHGERHPTELTDLYARRFVATIEAEEGHRFDEALVKWLTGGDSIRARRMHEDLWEWRPTHKLWLAANYKPVIRGGDLAIWRRIRLVPFTVTIPEGQRDPHLVETLRGESAGILRWAVDGCLAWQADGMGAPAAVRAATSEYQDEMDVIKRFISDHCTVGHFAQVSAKALYKDFLGWCSDQRERDMSQQMFGRRLTDRGYQRERRRDGYWWTGIGLVLATCEPCEPLEANPGLFPNEKISRGQSENSLERFTTFTPREPGEDDA